MKALIQRVSRASVTFDGETGGSISAGLLVLLGITHEDTPATAEKLLRKILDLRVFPSENSGFDCSLRDIQGGLLIVSQFTLYGDTRKGRRPDFSASAKPEIAEPLYDHFIQKARETGLKTATGRFGAMMEVELVNSGPVTLMIES
jgi:D-tyrosyl-tRNA(Tyr) deacylase